MVFINCATISFWVNCFQQAFSSASGTRKLIATGAAESEGAAPIRVWISTLGRKNRVMMLMTIDGTVSIIITCWVPTDLTNCRRSLLGVEH